MIAGNLEYLMSSLPHLTFNDGDEERRRVYAILKKYADPVKEDISMVAILEGEAKKYLSSSAFRLFHQIELKSIHSEVFQRSKYGVLDAFSNYVFWLKHQVRELRVSRKKGLESSGIKETLLPLDPGNPLQEEIQLLKWQWTKLEDLSIGHYSDFEALSIYKLKLLILLRWWSFNPEMGFDVFFSITKRD
ncbi:MAG: hypothetical protein WBV45_00410 [Lutimonas sp.]